MDQCNALDVTRVYTGHGYIYSVVITKHLNPHISQFNRPCNDFTSVWSMFQCNTDRESVCSCIFQHLTLQPNSLN